jgi:predicted RNase H-like HicB family nuclease
MATNYYLAVADKAPGEANWSILFPAFPGVTSVAERFADIMRQAKDALATAVEDIEAEDASLPPSIEEGSIPDFDRAGIHDPVALLVPVAPRQHN